MVFDKGHQVERLGLFILCEALRFLFYVPAKASVYVRIPSTSQNVWSPQRETARRVSIGFINPAELRDIVLIGGYCHTLLPKQATVVVNPDYAKTNMVYSLFCAQEQMDESCDWLITYGDIIYHASVLQAMLKADKSIAVATDVDWQCYWERRMEDSLKDAETFRWDTQTHRIVEIGKNENIGRYPRAVCWLY